MDDNSKLLILEMQRRAEQRLQAQLEIALASDARALTFCGLCLAAASLLVGLAAGGLEVAFYAAGIALFFAAALAAAAGRSTKFGAPGQPGRGYDDDLAANRPFHDVVAEVTRHIDAQTEANERQAAANGKLLEYSMWLAVLAPVIGLIALANAWAAG